ncbi:MAG TPA: chemotaxis protein CheW [Candidatus Binatia bacterium]|jgi:purine-binding chemotaxis protein CheW|nr:chemotaxis protein CheW [Candidatus Binatia bacterium]
MQIIQEETSRETEQRVQQYLTFMIGGEEYAVSLLKVKEIIEYDIVTEIPKTPEWVRGVINLRGNVVPVIDLAVKFRMAPSVPGKLTCIVITEVQCEGEATVMGIMADSVRQVIDLRVQDVEAPPTFGTRVKVDYLLGMARSGKKFCLLLDTEKVLSADELLELPDDLPPDEGAVIPTSDATTPEPVSASGQDSAETDSK